MKKLTDQQIRDICLANGYTIKPGNDDLKPYVYAAARDIEKAVIDSNQQKKETFWNELNKCIGYMQQEDVAGEVIVLTRIDSSLASKRIDSMQLLNVSEVLKCEMIVFDGANGLGDSWKHVFFPQQQTCLFVDENPLPTHG